MMQKKKTHYISLLECFLWIKRKYKNSFSGARGFYIFCVTRLFFDWFLHVIRLWKAIKKISQFLPFCSRQKNIIQIGPPIVLAFEVAQGWHNIMNSKTFYFFKFSLVLWYHTKIFSPSPFYIWRIQLDVLKISIFNIFFFFLRWCVCRSWFSTSTGEVQVPYH